MAIAGTASRSRKLPAKKEKEKTPRKKRRLSPLSLLVYGALGLLGLYILFQLGESVYRSVVLFRENQQLESQVEDLYYEKQLLLEQQEKGLSEEEIEARAKENLGLLKPGEEVIVLEDAP